MRFGNREFFRETVRIGLPIAIQGLLTSSLSFIDSLMIGSVGQQALAAVGAADSLAICCLDSTGGCAAAAACSSRSTTA